MSGSLEGAHAGAAMLSACADHGLHVSREFGSQYAPVALGSLVVDDAWAEGPLSQ